MDPLLGAISEVFGDFSNFEDFTPFSRLSAGVSEGGRDCWNFWHQVLPIRRACSEVTGFSMWVSVFAASFGPLGETFSCLLDEGAKMLTLLYISI